VELQAQRSEQMAETRPKILVVDDLPDWRITLGGLLADEGYDVQVAGSSHGALELLEADRFDLAVLDMRLDETDEGDKEGLDLAAEIGNRWPSVKVVIITGYGTPKVMKRALEPDIRGRKLAVNYIPKTEAGDLVKIVQKALTQEGKLQSVRCAVNKGRVLVVDDQPDVRTTLSGFLSDEGYDVRLASSRVEALKMVDAERFNVAVLDVRLDEADEDNQDGLLLMREIREKDPTVAIIILTSYAGVTVREALQPDREGVAPAFGLLEKSEADQLPAYIDRALLFRHSPQD
jgi:CheY-like chemotaxis protein